MSLYIVDLKVRHCPLPSPNRFLAQHVIVCATRKCAAMHKRSHPGDDSGPMRKFRRPHCSTVFSSDNESPRFELNVLVCTPQFGKYHHWAIQLHNLATGDSTIFEIRGAQPSCESTTYQCRLKYYPLRILKIVRLGQLTLSSRSLESISHAIENEVQARNDQADWTCQDYVLDILEMLEEEWWLDVDDNEYMDVKEKLKGMQGPMELVQKAVSTYSPVPLSINEATADVDTEKASQPRKGRTVQFAEDGEAG